MEPLNPYESPRGEVTPEALVGQEKFAAFPRQTQVGWGATICFWALAVYLIFNIGASQMMRLRELDQTWFFYGQMRYWGTWVGVILHVVGLFLLGQVREQTGAKTLFRISLVCFLAYEAWQLVQYFEPLDQHEAEPIPPSVEFLAQLTNIFAPLFLMIALRRISFYCHDRQLQRWSFAALFLFSVMAILQTGITALYLLAPGLLEDLLFKFKLEYFRIYELTTYLIMLLGVPVAYCYGRMLRRLAVLWEQQPGGAVLPVAETFDTNSGFGHEPESV
jgi:hypothetical protein